MTLTDWRQTVGFEIFGVEARDRLRRIADRLNCRRLPLRADALSLTEGIERCLSGDARLDVALGLVPAEPLRAESMAERNRLLLQLAAFFPGSDTGQAKAMAEAGQRYKRRCWPTYRNRNEPPPHHIGRLEAILFALHRNHEVGGARWPLGWRSIHTCLQFSRSELQTAPCQDGL